ncbi:MAG TPA: hypothetical protein VK668_23540 [Mucilaginibacter sp.]|nr:hypothetical protein [Mucilaginibacter sp.]
MKKPLLLFAIAAMLFSCKKESKQTPIYDVSGKWGLYSWKANIPYDIDVNANEYPCMSENELVFNTDQTTLSSYIGHDTCYVTHNLIDTHGGLRGTAIGVPGEASIPATWFRKGNDIYIGPEHGVITKVGDKLLLTIYDTLFYNGNKLFVTTVNIKK